MRGAARTICQYAKGIIGRSSPVPRHRVANFLFWRANVALLPGSRTQFGVTIILVQCFGPHFSEHVQAPLVDMDHLPGLKYKH